MITLLLIVYILNGKPHVDAYQSPSLEACEKVMPAVKAMSMEGAGIICINVLDEKAT